MMRMNEPWHGAFPNYSLKGSTNSPITLFSYANKKNSNTSKATSTMTEVAADNKVQLALR